MLPVMVGLLFRVIASIDILLRQCFGGFHAVQKILIMHNRFDRVLICV
jgi:hypothetical protein